VFSPNVPFFLPDACFHAAINRFDGNNTLYTAYQPQTNRLEIALRKASHNPPSLTVSLLSLYAALSTPSISEKTAPGVIGVFGCPTSDFPTKLFGGFF
jgi:hypothetical protein